MYSMEILEIIHKYCRFEGIQFHYEYNISKSTVTISLSYDFNTSHIRLNIGEYYPVKTVDSMIDKALQTKYGRV